MHIRLGSYFIDRLRAKLLEPWITLLREGLRTREEQAANNGEQDDCR
ncbi:MAG: hypothetical protein GY930_09975 [bacterium]|nr:hypothetical protein [bacterium]